MCKNTDASIGITVHRSPVMPPIENWYVVARTKSTGTCSIYSSWENYLAESKPISTTPSSSPSAAEKKKKPTVNAAKAIEVAAFPTMTQTIVYIKSFDRPTPKSVSSSSLAPSIPRNTIAGERTLPPNSPPDDSKSSRLQDTAAGAASDSDTSRDSHLSHPYKRRLYKGARKTIQAIDEGGDCHKDSNTNNDDRAATHAISSPSPIPSESPIKKRKTEIGTSQSSSVPIFTKRLTMSQTSETIDIGGPTTRKEPNTNSLDALAIAASKSTSKQVRKSTTSDENNKNKAATRTVASPPPALLGSKNRRTGDIIPRGPTHLMSPREIILPGMAQMTENTTRSSIVPSNIAARNTVTPKQHQIIMQQLKEEQQFQHQQQMEQNRQRRNKSLASSLIIPKVPTTFLASSLKIPEVPKGIIPAPADHQPPDQMSLAITDLKSSLDRKLWRLPSVSSIALQSASNRMSLDSYPLGNFPRQLQHLPQHLQALQHQHQQQQQASMYRSSSHIQVLPLEAPNHHLLSSGAIRHHFQQQQKQQHMYPQTIDLASSPSVTSDCDHSEVTLKRRNGPSSGASSPARFQRNIKSPTSMGTIYATKNPEDSLQQKTLERNRRDE